MLPAIISEQFVRRFNFWASGEIQEGMYYGNELYRLVSTFHFRKHEQAYALGTDIAQHGKQTIITCSENSYAVWVSLRSCQLSKGEVTAPSLVLKSVSTHPAVGKCYRVRTTNHPQARAYQHQDCQVLEVWQRAGGPPMANVQLQDGTEIRGLFLSELEEIETKSQLHLSEC